MGRAKKKRLNKYSRQVAKPKSEVTLPSWDQGAMGPANRVGLVSEERGEINPDTGKIINPNGIRGVRRVDMLGVWHRKGVISTAGYSAAELLRNAFEATQCAPGWPEAERVQSSPKPDVAVTIQIDRLSNYHHIAKRVIEGDRKIIAVCVLGSGTPASAGYRGARYQDGLAHLRDALDRLSDAMQRR